MRDSIATICSCYDAGAYGFISKAANTDLLIDAIRTVSQNECYFPPGVDQEIADFAFKIKNNIPQSTLTKSELETFIQLASGLSQDDIAANFNISLKNVKNRTLLLKQKLDIPLNRFTQVAKDFDLMCFYIIGNAPPTTCLILSCDIYKKTVFKDRICNLEARSN